MQAAENRLCYHFALPLHAAHDRRISIKGLMRAILVVISHVLANGAQQVLLPHRNDVIRALSADASDDSFDVRILPR